MNVGPDVPRFSVVVLNWNGREVLDECLESLAGQTFRDFELLVVDNGSTDGSAPWVRERWPEAVRLVVLPQNRGFAGGNNEGIRLARGRYVVLLNNDTTVDPGWLAALSAAVERHPEAGLFTPKILNYYRRNEIDNTGHLLYPDGLARGHNRLEKDDGRFDEEREALHPSGCAGVYRRDLLDDVGVLDEWFFAYAEDVDLGLRARWAGWTCLYVPTAVVYHKYSATTGAYSPGKAFLVERNRLWTLVKNFPLRDVLVSPVWTLWRYGWHAAGALRGTGASGQLAKHSGLWPLASALVRANLAALAGIPRVLAQRRSLRRTRRLSTREFRLLVRRFRLSAAEVGLKE